MRRLIRDRSSSRDRVVRAFNCYVMMHMFEFAIEDVQRRARYATVEAGNMER